MIELPTPANISLFFSVLGRVPGRGGMQKEAQLLCGCSSALFSPSRCQRLCGDTSTFPAHVAHSRQLLSVAAHVLQHADTGRVHASARTCQVRRLRRRDGLEHTGNHQMKLTNNLNLTLISRIHSFLGFFFCSHISNHAPP